MCKYGIISLKYVFMHVDIGRSHAYTCTTSCRLVYLSDIYM